MKVIFSLVLTFFTGISAYAQLEKTIHQTFEIGEASALVLDVTGEYSIIPWAGNTVMTETQIYLYDASPSILNHLVEKDKRYQIEAKQEGESFLLYSLDKKRDTIRTKHGSCTETVQLKIYVPETFVLQGDNRLVRIKKDDSD